MKTGVSTVVILIGIVGTFTGVVFSVVPVVIGVLYLTSGGGK